MESPITFLNEEENNKLLEYISHYRPTNLINLDEETNKELISLWQGDKKEDLTIPSDIFFNRTVPLTDCNFCVMRGAEQIYFQVLIYPDYADRIANADDEFIIIGVVSFEIAGGSLLREIEVHKGDNNVMCTTTLGYRKLNKAIRKSISDSISEMDFLSYFSDMFSTWYAVQIALLHPVIKDVFSNPQTIVDNTAKLKGTKRGKKRPLRYIKKHNISAKDITQRLYTDSNYQRHTLVWYVIGHWRTYADGRKVFVKPHWKGALRDNKSGDIREREVRLSDISI